MKLVSFSMVALMAPAMMAQSLQWSQSQVDLVAEAGSSTAVSAKVRLANLTGVVISFQLTTQTPWVGMNPMLGTIPPGGGADITLSADPSTLSSGTYRGQISAIVQASSEVFPLTVTLTISGVQMLVTPPSFDFAVAPENMGAGQLDVGFSDGVQREYTVTAVIDTGSWLQVIAPSPNVGPNSIKVQVSAQGMVAGEVHNGELRLAATGSVPITKTVPVRMVVSNTAQGFLVVPGQMEFFIAGGLPLPPQPLFVFSTTNRSTQYDVVPPPETAPFLTISPLRAQPPGIHNVQVNANALPSMPRADQVEIRTTSVTPYVVPVKVDVEPKRVYSIPQIADGGRFRTQLTVVNNDKATATVTLAFYKSDPATHITTPWNVPLDGNPALANVTIPVGGSWTVQTTGAAATVSSGWAQVISSQSISGQAVFQLLWTDGRTQEAAVPINSLPMQRSYLAFDNTSGFVTSMAIVNVDDKNAAKVQVAFRDPAGNLIRVDRLPDLPVLGHYPFELTSLFPYLIGLRGTADFWTLSGRISLLGLRFNSSGAFTSFETQQVHRRDVGRRTIPQIADGGSPAAAYRTTIFLVNNDSVPATASLKFHRNLGTGETADWNLLLQGGATTDNIQIPAGGSVVLQTAGLSQTINQGWAEIVSDQWVSGYAVFRQVVSGSPDQEAAIPINIGSPNRQAIPFDNTTGYTTSVAVANLSTDFTATVNFIFKDATGQRITIPVMDTIPPQGHKAFRLVDLFPGIAGMKGTLEVSTLGGGQVSAVGLRFAPSGAYTSIKATALQ